ncbi:MAG: phosphate ABC transporter substrate-binding protein PstS [Proteobacteria bacterium]|nr:phosphate ABC transporter substrate-binding protein PstS [Pseudomonadota bacterium]MCL2308245.1 phosphate ABC transporter substrate-binding protein PstS [Pseudomonadota bacterium]
MSRRWQQGLVGVLAAGAFSLAAVAQSVEVTGAGASFPAPLYAKWADVYSKETGHRINYQSIGSGGGIKQIQAKTVDFGATDAPMKPEDLEKSGLAQFPTVIGGVVPVVNIKGIGNGQLRLSGSVLADIYLGKITRWNDPAITALNPELKLPSAAIAVVRRSDGAGTTFVFTSYLSKVSADWKANVGEGTAVQWPVGLGGKGNEGVSAFVLRIGNSIGYVESAYAKFGKMAYVLMQNAAGEFVAPTGETFSAAAAGATWDPASFYAILTDQPGEKTWPISGATFILMHKTQDKPMRAKAALDYFAWAFKNGGKIASELDYAPLPESLTRAVEASWAQIKDVSGKAVY